MTAASTPPSDLWSRLRASAPRPTLRGAAVAAVGLLLVIAGPVLGRREAVSIGLFLLTASALSLILLALRSALSREAAHHRVLIPDSAAVGERVQVRFLSAGGEQHGGLSPVDQLPPTLTRRSQPTRQTDGPAPGYTLTAGQRGVFSVGPATELWKGPLGLARGRILRAGVSRLRVLPQLHDEQVLEELFRTGLGDDRSADLFGVRGSADDLLVREHRPRDPLSRIHWGATARTRQLMVRQEESTEDPRAVVVLDRRGRSYPQGHHTVDAGDGTSWITAPQFEEAVRLAASLHHVLERSGQDVTLLDHEGTVLSSDLADVQLAPSTREASWMERLPRGTTTVFAVLGAGADADLPHLRHLPGVTQRTALLMGPSSALEGWHQAGWATVDASEGAR